MSLHTNGSLFPFIAAICAAIICAPRSLAAGESDVPDKSAPGLDHISFYQKYISDLRYGHCGFRPSCSQFAADAIGKHGLIVGSVLAADRLIRCHPGAYRYYERGDDGKMIDPVDGDYGSLAEPRLPPWLLPDMAELPPPFDFADESPAGRLMEYTAFGDALSRDGDCYRAGTEYKRVAFLAGDPGAEGWARFKTGTCYFNTESWSEAAAHFIQAAWWSREIADRNVAYYMAASSRFNAGEYAQCMRDLGRCTFEEAAEGQESEDMNAGDSVSHRSWTRPHMGVDFAQTQLLSGLCLMADGQWQSAQRRFDGIVLIDPASPYRGKAAFLASQATGRGLPRRNQTLAAAMSAVIPGSGQLYAGRGFDGLRHFIFNGILIYSVVSLFREEHYGGGYLLAAFTLPFYVGNIAGAKKSAGHYNAARRRDYLATTINEAPKR